MTNCLGNDCQSIDSTDSQTPYVEATYSSPIISNIVALKILYLISFLLEDKIYLWLFCWFNSRMILNFKNPKTFNDKLNWLKINDRKKL